MTLALLNEKLATRGKSGGTYTVEHRFAVGRNGNASSNRGTTGALVHLITVDVIVAEEGEHKPGTYKVGQNYMTQGLCFNRGGQHNATVIDGYDLDKITCPKCQKIAAHNVARAEAR